MSRLQSFVDRVLRAEVIKGTADQYMKCWWLLALPGERRVYLHKFVGSDWSRDLHDHPKWFVSIGLWGGYVEEVGEQQYVHSHDLKGWLTKRRRPGYASSRRPTSTACASTASAPAGPS